MSDSIELFLVILAIILVIGGLILALTAKSFLLFFIFMGVPLIGIKILKELGL